MTKPLTTKDYILISAYLDGELNSSRQADVEKRLLVDPDFKNALEELGYTKRLLSSMPQVRARRNFTLTPDKVKKTVRPQRFQPVWGAVSAFSTLMLIVVFAVSQFAPKMAAMPSAPMMTSAEDNAVTAEKLADGVTSTPMIILWNPQRAYGMGGGGGGDASDTAIKTGSTEAPLAAAPNPEGAPSLSATAEVAPQADMDPSTLILGLPASDTQGQTFNRESQDQLSQPRSLSATAWMMIGAGAAALIAALLAIFTRRR
jgi:hypothetical protein